MISSVKFSRYFQWLVMIVLAALVLPVCAKDTPNTPPEAVEKAIRSAYKAKMPGARIAEVRIAPAGWYEILFEDNSLVYTDKTGRYMLQGNFIDLDAKKSLTAQRYQEIRKVVFSQLPFDKAIVEVKGNGSRKMAVFSDPDCPFCKKFELETLSGMTDVTVYTFLTPLTQLHPDALNKANKIWCASNRLQAWRDWMQVAKLPATVEGTSCKAPVEIGAKIADQWGLEGTPGIMLENGAILRGAYPQDEVEAAFSKN